MNKAHNTAAKSKKQRKTRQELNEEGRERKRQKKHKGHAAGSRHNVEASAKGAGRSGREKDPRIGSKTPVSLVPASVNKVEKPVNASAAKSKLTPVEELEKLENSPRLDELLQRLEEGEKLAPADQTFVDKTLDRIDELMTLLGIELDDEEQDENEKQEDILQLLKRH